MVDERPPGAGESPDDARQSDASNPYGGSGTPPPAYPPGGQDAPPPRSDRWKIWVGIVLTIPVMLATLGLAATAGFADNSGALSGFVLLAGLVLPIVLLFPSSTRKFGLGLLIGYAVVLVLGAGVCVALLSSYN